MLVGCFEVDGDEIPDHRYYLSVKFGSKIRIIVEISVYLHSNLTSNRE
jgi:hypothetical protein